VKKKIVFYTTEATKSMKTKDRLCKIGEKRTGFCAEMTRILQEEQLFCAFLPLGSQPGA
jgi:hypothetical protein